MAQKDPPKLPVEMASDAHSILRRPADLPRPVPIPSSLVPPTLPSTLEVIQEEDSLARTLGTTTFYNKLTIVLPARTATSQIRPT